jgi:hypothetical protein
MTAEKRVWRRVSAALIASAVLVGFSAIIPSATAQDNASRFSYVRLYCTPDNESHFTDVRAELTKENFAPPAAPIAIGGNRPSSRSFIAGFEAQWGAGDLQASQPSCSRSSAVNGAAGGIFDHRDRWRDATATCRRRGPAGRHSALPRTYHRGGRPNGVSTVRSITLVCIS